jgi:hypothetical protein
MKHAKPLFTVLAIVSIVIFSSCKKTSTTVDPVPAASGAFTFKVDGGATITVDSANAAIYNRIGFGRFIDVYAFKGGTQVLEFHFAPTTGVKDAATTLLSYLTKTPLNSYDSQSGSLNLITCDTVTNKLIGDFNFVGKSFNSNEIKTITEGHMVVTKIIKY